MKSLRLTAVLVSLMLLLVAGISIRAQTSEETPEPVSTAEVSATDEMSATEESVSEPTVPSDPFYTGNGSARIMTMPVPLDPAAGSGFVRFVHVSPDTGPIDIYMDDMLEPLVMNLQLGEYTGAVRIRSGDRSFTARAAGSAADSQILNEFDWNLASNSTWLIAAVGRQADATFQLEPLNILRNFSQQVARLRLANVNPYLSGLSVTVQEGESLAERLGWLGSYDLDLVVGADAGTQEGMLNIVVEDADDNVLSEPVSLPIRPFLHYSILLTSMDDPAVVTPLIIPSTRAVTRVRFASQRTDPIEVLILPSKVVLVPRLEPATVTEYFILPSEAATFAAYAPGTGPNGQNLAGLPAQLEPEYDYTITFLPNGSVEVTEKVFTVPMTATADDAEAAGTEEATQ